MSNRTYKSVIVGLTGIGAARPLKDDQLPVYGPMPRSHASAYQRHPRTKLTAVCDLRTEALESFRNDWSDVWPDIRLYTDYAAMLAGEEADIVSIATSDHAHADITVAAAKSGTRAILCEKPIATSLVDADRIIEAAEANDVLLSIEHTRRWDPIHLTARQLLRDGELGPLRTILCEMFSQRAMLFRNGTHVIDLINFFADSEPQWLVAELESGFDDFTEYQGDGGIRAFFNSYKVNFPGSQTVLTCQEGRLEISDRGASLIRGSSHFEWSVSNIVTGHYQYTHQLGAVAELIEVLENGGDLISSGREARKTLEVILAMLESHHNANSRIDLPLS